MVFWVWVTRVGHVGQIQSDAERLVRGDLSAAGLVRAAAKTPQAALQSTRLV